MSDQVVVVGGGLAGLVTAYELRAQGIPSIVLEASDRIGGRVRTIDFPDGATAESCMEEVWESSPAYPLLRELGLPLIGHSAHSSVVIDDQLIPFHSHDGGDSYFEQLGEGSGRRSLSIWNVSARAVLDDLARAQETGRWSRRLCSLRKRSFASFVGDLHLSQRVETWVRLMLESETAANWDHIAALDGLSELSPFLMSSASSRGETNVRVAGGNERFIEALLAAHGEQPVRLNARVNRVVDNGHCGVEVHYEDETGRHRVEHGHHAVLTAPLWSLKSIHLDPGLDLMSRAAISSTHAGSYVKVVLRVPIDRVAMWERNGEHPFTLLTEGPTGCVYLTDGRATGRDHVVTMLVHGDAARALNGRPTPEIVERSITALDQFSTRSGSRRVRAPLFIGLRGAVTDARVFDHPNAVAYWPRPLGRSRYDALADALREPHGRILIGGDSTDSSHSDGAVRAGQRMASVILERSSVLEAVLR